MPDLLRGSRGALVVWAALMAATLASWWLGIEEGGEPGEGAALGGVAAIVLAFAKIRFVGSHFMELREAPLVLRVILDAYVVVVGVALVVIYVVTS